MLSYSVPSCHPYMAICKMREKLLSKLFLSHCTQDMTQTFQSIVNLLLCLKANQSLQESQPSRVRFHEPGNNDNERKKTNAITKRRTKVSDVDLLYGGRLLATVSKTVCKSLERVWTEDSEADLVLVTELLKEYFSTSLLNDILMSLKSFSAKDDVVKASCSNNSELSNLSTCCINELVLPLLNKIGLKANEKWLSCSVQLLFLLLVEVEENEQKCVFERVFEVRKTIECLLKDCFQFTGLYDVLCKICFTGK